MYDLIVVKQKWYKNKLILLSLLLLLIVAIISCSSIIIASLKYSKTAQKENTLTENITISETTNQNIDASKMSIADKPIDTHVYEFKRNVNVVITEEIINNVKSIYTSEEKRAFLTFDDGPSQTVTIPILDLLKQENIKVTFFTLGSRIEFYPEIVRRAYNEGHYIANHGYSHKYKSIYTSPQAVLDEYLKTEELIKNAIGEPEYNSHLFRFPGGSHGGKYSSVKKEAIELLKTNNIMYVDWNALTGDSEGKTTKEAMMQYLIETIGDKTSIVILMHDAGDKVGTYELLPEIIAYLRDNGFVFKNFYDIIK